MHWIKIKQDKESLDLLQNEKPNASKTIYLKYGNNSLRQIIWAPYTWVTLQQWNATQSREEIQLQHLERVGSG